MRVVDARLQVLEAETSAVGVEATAGKSQRLQRDAAATALQLVGEAVRGLHDVVVGTRIASSRRYLCAAVDVRWVPKLMIEAPVARALLAAHEDAPLGADRALAMRTTIGERPEVGIFDHQRHVGL